MRHGVGGVVAKRGADHREDRGDLGDTEERLDPRSQGIGAGDAIGEIPGGNGKARGEDRADRERGVEEKAQREHEGVARRKDHRRMGAVGADPAHQEASEHRGLGRLDRPGEEALSDGARFEVIARGVDDPRASAEVRDDIRSGERR